MMEQSKIDELRKRTQKPQAKRDALLATRILAKIQLHTHDNPILSRAMEEEYSISGKDLRQIIHTHREGGHPIGSSGDGYFYARTYAEIEPTCAHFKSRAMSMLGVMNKMAERFTGEQQTIFG